ncbi:hypothetical protein CTEN210_03627 [Chaetoceros tenuissimus]|uniref:Leucine-rich repeat domain-containing protein n=1 Tax=Chaetoceros tenuissimus TaxID=426638 RepID=A0AAD3CJE1_9STRA|nr:hypothetical protein CTEN210_03627 [Chaetoceros tenuissimus]
MYKGKKTLFYNGEILWEGHGEEAQTLIYDYKERDSWQVIIVLPGVEVIPDSTFSYCRNIETVVMADTVRRIEYKAFFDCRSLLFVKLSTNLEYIGFAAFWFCESLTSIFIPPSCREIDDWAFRFCRQLSIVGMSQQIQFGNVVFQQTLLLKRSPFELDEDGWYDEDDDEEVVEWVKSINNEDAYALHRACASFNPLSEIILALVKRQGIKAMRMPNTIGITPSQYLEANVFADISEKEIINRNILETMGEVL